MQSCRQAVILAAGRGSRLAAVTAERPKCLVEIAGAPLLDTLVARLFAAGIHEIVLVVGYRAELVRHHLARQSWSQAVALVDNPDYASSNNAVSLWLARERIRPPFILLDGDLWLADSVVAALRQPDRVAVAERPGRGTRARIEGDRILAIDPESDGRGPEWLKTVNAASFSPTWWRTWFRPALERLVDAGSTDEFYERAMADALSAGAPPLAPVLVPDPDWIEIDTPDDLARARILAAAS